MPPPGDSPRTDADFQLAESAPDDATMVGAPTIGPQAGRFGPPAAAGEVGTLGPYRLVKQLGRGGMGAVYAAVDTRLGRRIAVKTMLPQFAADPEAKERFLREARAAGQIAHDNVVTVFEADERDGVPYIAMQFLQGHSLEAHLARHGELDVQQVVRIATDAAAGLSAAHEIGLVHRDIKPANLWLEAPHGRVKVLDFGLAKPADTDIGLTKSGMVVGTPAYMSPEQGRGEKVDARSDLFSLGAVMYRLCTGKLPFDGSTTMAVLTALATADPPPIRARNPNVPESLVALIGQLLAKDPQARPQSAGEVVRRLGDPSSQSVVVAIPVAIPVVTDLDNPFTGLEQTAVDSAPISRVTPARSAALRADGRGGWLWAVAASVFAGVVVVGAVLAMRPRDRDEPRPAPPPGPGAKVVPNVAPKLAPDPDRKAAEWVLSAGGAVRVNGAGIDVRTAAELPKERFRLTAVNLDGRPVTANGLVNLAGLTALTELNLKNSNATDAGLAHIKDVYTLQSLDLTGTPVTDAALAHLTELTSLVTLNLTATSVTDAGLADLPRLPSLSQVLLNGTKVTDAGVAHLRGVKRLDLLDLQHTTVTDAGLVHVGACTGLGHLHLGGTKVTGPGLAHLGGLTRLYALRLHDLPLTDAALPPLRTLTGLRHLILPGTQATDAGLVVLAEMPWLLYLEIYRTQATAQGVADFHAAAPGCQIAWDKGNVDPVDVTRKAAEWVLSVGGSVKVNVNGQDRDIKTAAELPKEKFGLGTINLDGKPVTDADLAHLRHLYDLPQLYLNGTKVTDAGLATVGRLHGLILLWLGHTAVTDAGLAALKPLRALKQLSLAGTAVTDAGLPHVAELKRLQILGIDHTKVTGPGLAHLTALPDLTVLWLTGAPITDDALAHLKGCKALRDLMLMDTALTDAAFVHLKAYPALALLDVQRTKVTAKGLADFSAAMPACKVVSDAKK